MSRLEITLSLILTASLLANVGLVVYLRSALVRLLSFSEELYDLQGMITNFSEHVNTIYGMEMFYGDETLQFLMEHAQDFNAQLSNFDYIYNLVEKEDDGESEQTKTEEKEEAVQE
tara:strand:- start:187 stop:534 length:348 start_codon:yes stop_codon:yes gene_type:complete